MNLTVENILDYNIMKNAKARTGINFISMSYVQWISVIEMPVENFVRKNEVVLSTAIGCGQDIKLFEEFVKDIIESEAAALVIALGKYVFDIPKEVIELAESKNFIIIEIPWEVRFSDVIENVMKEINSLHYKEREQSEKVQQELLKLILQETNLNYIAKFVQNHIEAPIIITDQGGIIQGKSSSIKGLEQLWKDYSVKGLIPSNKQVSTLTHDPAFQKFEIIDVEGYLLLQLPILQVSGDAQGYIFVVTPFGTSIESFLTPYRAHVLEHLATSIALWFSRKNAIEETKMRIRSDFVQDLAQGTILSQNQANSRAKLLGYNLNCPYICIVGKPENLKDKFQKWKLNYKSFEDWLENMIRYIEEEIFYAAQSLGKQLMVTYHGELLLIYLEVNYKLENNGTNNFLDLVDRRLCNLLPEIIISWGIGNYHEGIKGFEKSYQNAKVALNIGKRKRGSGTRTMYENTKIDRVLLNLGQDKGMREIIMSTVEPLVQYDEARNADLITTFTTFNECHGNVSQTARELNLHRQSLRYRLRKIEFVTGLSLTNPEDLFLLDLSIKTWKLGISE